MGLKNMAGSFLWILLCLYGVLMLSIVIFEIGVKPAYSNEAVSLFGIPFLQKAAGYSAIKWLPYVLDKIIWAGFVFIFLRIARSGSYTSIKAIIFLALFLIIMYAVTFPLSWWRGFLIEKSFGLSSQSLGGWLLDYGKSVMVSFLLSFAGYCGLYFLIGHFPRNWWLLAWAALLLFSLISTILYPLVIDPLFYNFEPLQDQEMVASIKEMGHKAGINIDQVLVADASRRTVKANAYFTGLGRTRRIVIYDNLLNRFSSDQALAVVAHEIGHWKSGHLLKWLLISVPAFFLFMAAAFGITRSLGGKVLTQVMIVIVLYVLLSTVALPVQNLISRNFERQADQVALELTGNPQALVDLYVNLAQTNYSNVEPHPLTRSLWYSHPPIMERIRVARNYY